MTVADLCRSISMHEFMEWIAYLRLKAAAQNHDAQPQAQDEEGDGADGEQRIQSWFRARAM